MYVISLLYTPGVPNIIQLTEYIQNLYLYSGLYIPIHFDKIYIILIYLRIVRYFVILKSLLK